MIKNLRKAFTIIELVIVIAVIAILAAVLIPTFSSLVDKANESVDMQLVKQMNTILEAEEITDDKPLTVIDVQDILDENGIIQFSPVDKKCEFYWVGSENRIILWEWENDEKLTGKVTYPDEYVKRFKDISKVSIEWYNLGVNYGVVNIIPTDGSTLVSALIDAIENASEDSTNYFVLPEDSDLTFTSNEIEKFNTKMLGNSGIGKRIYIDLNGSILKTKKQGFIFIVPNSGSLEIIDGEIEIDSNNDWKHAGFQVKEAASLTLRNVNITGSAGTMIFPSNNASEVIVDECNILVDANYILMSNGMTSNNLRIIIKNSYLKNIDGSVGVLVNCTSSVYIENSTISSRRHVLVMRAGYVEVINSILESYNETSGKWKYDQFTYFYKKPKKNGEYIDGASETYVWSEGNQIPAAVLVLGDYNENADDYLGDVVCNLTNVKFNSKNSSEIPDCLLAAKLDKNVILTYDSYCNLDTPILYNYMIPKYFGTITINGVSKTLN